MIKDVAVIDTIRIAVPKDNTSVSNLFRDMGCSLQGDWNESRKYIVPVPAVNMEFLLAKSVDIPTYVEYGIADIGVAGKEILLEANREVYELLDLNVSAGYLSMIGKSGINNASPRIATAYPKIANKYFKEKGKQAEIIKLSGGIELAFNAGLADYMIEIYDNQRFKDFIEIEKICRISYRLIANRASYQVKYSRIQEIYEALTKRSD